MLPVYNLLYEEAPHISPSAQQEMSIKALLLDEVIEDVTVDIILQKKIFALIGTPESSLKNILWRCEILDDFRKNASLLREMTLTSQLCEGIDEAMKIVKRNVTSVITTAGGRAVMSDRESSIFTVRTLADCIIKALELYTQYEKMLGRMKLSSRLFTGLLDFVRKQTALPAFSELKSIASALSETLNLSTSFVITAKIDKYIRIMDCEMFALTADPYSYAPSSDGKKDKEKDVSYIGFDPDSDQQLTLLAERSMSKLTAFLESVALQLKSPFDKLAEGFYFYEFAAILERTYEDLGLPCCTASYAESENVFECKNIYDLWFALKQRKKHKGEKPGDTLVPNDAIISKDCAAYIITGKNNAGKTVFLRAVGIIQILAQAGLPVPCTEAKITPVNGIYAYFTALDVGQGRFEEEVETVSRFLDVLKPRDMLLFNEVYQSTSFDEASVALSEFIAATALYGARVISVTHLPDMKKNLEALRAHYGFEGEVLFYKSEEVNGESTHRFIQDLQ